MQLTILGNSAGGPFHGRHYTSQVLQVDNQMFLIDCGEGTQMQLFKFRIKYDQIRQIFISHLHGDHIFGLMGLITNWSLKKRSAKLELFSPPGLQELIETNLRICQVRMSYPLEFHEVDASISHKAFENQTVEVWTIPLEHRTACSGWLFREKKRPRTILKEKIDAYDIPFALIPGIKAGDDLTLADGRRIPNAELTTDPPNPRTFAFCSDTAFSEQVVQAVQGVNLLYHEATFTNTNREEAFISYHSTAEQAATVALQAGVQKLVIGHFSGRYADTIQHLAEARTIFPSTDAAEEGMPITI